MLLNSTLMDSPVYFNLRPAIGISIGRNSLVLSSKVRKVG